MLPRAAHLDYSGSGQFQPGDIVNGRYRIVCKLADGGMGTVFLAEHTLMKRRFAIKRLHSELATDSGMVERFLNEASAAGTLGHPHIVESTDMGFTRENIPYIVFEYLEGCLLSEEIRRLGSLPVRRALLITRQIASALEAAHNAQIAHLDLKSDNVFLTDRGDAPDHAKLLDFGISRFMEGDARTTQPSILMGTPEFMAPEQVITPDLADCRTDIYGLGVLLYEMLAGRCPFMNEDPRWVLHQVVYEPPPPLERSVPVALDRLLFGGLLVKSREHRLHSMAEVLTILDPMIAAMRPGLPDPIGFEEPNPDFTSPIWLVEGGLDDAPDPPCAHPTSATPTPEVVTCWQRAAKPRRTLERGVEGCGPGHRREARAARNDTAPPPSRAPVASSRSAK